VYLTAVLLTGGVFFSDTDSEYVCGGTHLVA